MSSLTFNVVRKHVVEFEVSGNSVGGTSKIHQLMRAMEANDTVHGICHAYFITIKLKGGLKQVQANQKLIESEYKQAARSISEFMFKRKFAMAISIETLNVGK